MVKIKSGRRFWEHAFLTFRKQLNLLIDWELVRVGKGAPRPHVRPRRGVLHVAARLSQGEIKRHFVSIVNFEKFNIYKVGRQDEEKVL